MATVTRNVFISHVHEDDKELVSIKNLLRKKGYSIRDSSIDSSKPNEAKDSNYIKTGILAPRIRWAGVVLVLISPDTHKSEYVNWEIEYATKQNKKVVGVFVRGAKDANIPEALETYGDGDACGWNAESIIDAIENDGTSWVKANGNVRPVQPIKRIGC